MFFAIILGFAIGFLLCIPIYILHIAFGEYIDNIQYKIAKKQNKLK